MGLKLSSLVPSIANGLKNLKTGDLFSPVLVKEIRQGMRTRTFVGVFLLVQVVMMFTMIIGVFGAAADDGGDRTLSGMATTIYWAVIGLPLALIMPSRGFGAVGTEIRSGTLEPLHLTRLSAWRIVFGKWFSLFAQTMLLLVALLPFAVLRYFLGGVNIIDELTIIAFLVLFSAMFTAVAVGSSAFPSALWRVFLGLGVAVGVVSLLGVFLRSISMGVFGMSAPFPSSSGLGWVVFVVMCVIIGYLFLEYGAAEIAPPAENHALRKRLAALAIVGCIYLFREIRGFEFMIWIGVLVVLTVIGLALIERPVLVRSVYFRNATRPAPIRFLTRQFYPGWPFALMFCFVVWALCYLVFLDDFDDVKSALGFLGVFSSLLWCATVTHLLLPATRRPIGFFILLQIACMLLAFLASALQSVRVINYAFWLIPFPPAVFWYGLSGSLSGRHEMLYLYGVVFMGLLSLIVLAIRGRKARLEVAKIEREFREQKRAQSTPS